MRGGGSRVLIRTIQRARHPSPLLLFVLRNRHASGAPAGCAGAPRKPFAYQGRLLTCAERAERKDVHRCRQD